MIRAAHASFLTAPGPGVVGDAVCWGEAERFLGGARRRVNRLSLAAA